MMGNSSYTCGEPSTIYRVLESLCSMLESNVALSGLYLKKQKVIRIIQEVPKVLGALCRGQPMNSNSQTGRKYNICIWQRTCNKSISRSLMTNDKRNNSKKKKTTWMYRLKLDNIHIKRSSLSLIMRWMQKKINNITQSIEWLTFKKLVILSIGEDVGQWELSHTADGKVKRRAYMGQNLQVF